MFILKKKLILICLITLLSSCTLNNFEKIQNINNYSLQIETPDDKFNFYFKKNLERLFVTSDTKHMFILKTEIAFNSTNTLSVGGQSVLKSTKAKINYELTNKNTNVVVKSGSFTTFPALNSLSNSLYTQEKSIEHIIKRLTKNSAKSLYTRINIILSRLIWK